VGLQKASSRWVAFLDADDIWKPNKLERQVSTMRRQNVGLCVEGHDTNKNDFVRSIVRGDIESVTPSILIDTKKVSVYFNTDIERMEDHLFLIKAALEAGVCLCEDLVQVRKHNKGLSSNTTNKDLYNSELKIAKELEKLRSAKTYSDRYRASAYYRRGRHLQKKCKVLKSLGLFFKSLNSRVTPRCVMAILIAPYYLVQA